MWLRVFVHQLSQVFFIFNTNMNMDLCTQAIHIPLCLLSQDLQLYLSDLANQIDRDSGGELPLVVIIDDISDSAAITELVNGALTCKYHKWWVTIKGMWLYTLFFPLYISEIFSLLRSYFFDFGGLNPCNVNISLLTILPATMNAFSWTLNCALPCHFCNAVSDLTLFISL